MTWLELVIVLVIAGLCGSIGRSIGGSSRGGFLVSIALGFIGAILGLWLARKLQLPEPLLIRTGDTAFPVLWSIVGSALFVALISLLTRGGRSA